MRPLRSSIVCLVMGSASLVACASDEAPSDDAPVEEDVPFDDSVDDGVDTEVERSENMGLDGDDA